MNGDFRKKQSYYITNCCVFYHQQIHKNVTYYSVMYRRDMFLCFTRGCFSDHQILFTNPVDVVLWQLSVYTAPHGAKPLLGNDAYTLTRWNKNRDSTEYGTLL